MATPSQHPSERSSDILLFSRPSPISSALVANLPIKRIKRPAIVLPEDEYTDALSKIIKRDFFPDLVSLEAVEALVAAAQRDRDLWVNGRAEVRLTHPEAGAHSGDDSDRIDPTPSDIKTVRAIGGQLVKVNTGLSLSAFQSLYTSEDNESFDAVLDRQNAVNAHKHAWLWSAIADRQPTVAEVAHRERERRRMLDIAPAALKAVDDAEAIQLAQLQLAYGTGPTIPQNSLILRSHHPDIRPAAPDVRLENPRNALLFLPDSIEDRYETVMQANERKSLAGPKMVVHRNTRLPPGFGTEPDRPSEILRPGSPTMSDVQRAIRSGVDSAAPNQSNNTDSRRSKYDPHNPRSQFVSHFQAQARSLGVMEYESDEEREPPNTAASSSAPDVTSQSASFSKPKPSSSLHPTFQFSRPTKREQLHHRMIDRVAKRNRMSGAAVADRFTPTASLVDLTPSSALFTPLQTASSRATPSGLLNSRSSKQGPSLSAAGSRLLQGILSKPKSKPNEVAQVAAALLQKSAPPRPRLQPPQKSQSIPPPCSSPPPSSSVEPKSKASPGSSFIPSSAPPELTLPPRPQPSGISCKAHHHPPQSRPEPSKPRSPSPLPPSLPPVPPPSLLPTGPTGVVNGVRSGPRFENLTPSQLFHATTNYRYAAFRNNHPQGPGAAPVPKPRSNNYFYSQPQLQQSGNQSSSQGNRRRGNNRSGGRRPLRGRRR